MNYGEIFIETYNNSFINLKKDYKKFLKDNFEADETFPIIFDRYVSKLYDLQHAQYSKDNLLIKCWEEFLYRYHKYNKNAARNIINKNILQIFEKNKSNHSSKITDFSNFVDSLAKLSIAKDFEHRIKDDIKDIEKALLSKNISAILKVEKQVNAEYLVDYSLPKKEINLKPKKSILLDNNQKMIILHVLKNYYKDNKDNDTDTEYFKIISLCSDALTEKDFNSAKTNNIKYKYFLYGANNSDIKGKARIIDDISTVLAPINGLNRIKRALNVYKNKLKY
jgi:hypothetical protein